MALSPATWAVAQQVGRVLLASVFYFIIAGLLTPAEIGVLGIATVWIAFLGVFAELGFGAALIQRRVIDDRHLATVFIMNVALGCLLFAVGAAVAGPASELMRTPGARPIILVLSAGFVVNAFSTVQAALAARQLRFRALALRDFGGVIVGGLVGVAFAYAGAGVWSLVAQTLTTSVVGTLLLWRLSRFRPRLRDWSSPVLRDLWAYSSQLFGLNVFKYFVQNSDALVIGYFFGPFKLGLYALANKLLIQPVVAIETGVGAFVFPRAAQLQDERAQVAALYTAAYKTLNYVVLPFLAIGGVWGGVLAPAILGQEWSDIGPVFWFLAAVGALHPPISPVGQLMKALGKPDWFLRWGVMFSASVTVALLLGSQLGFVWALAALPLAYFVLLPVNFLIVDRLLPGELTKILQSVAPSYLAGAFFGSVLLCSRVWGGQSVLVATGSILAATVLYVPLVLRSDPVLASFLRRQVAALRTA